MKLIGRAIVAITAGVWSLASAHAVQLIELRTAAQLSSTPKFVVANDAGSIAGLCIDLHRAIEKADPVLRLSGDQQWRPLPRVEAELRAGTLDVACGLLRTREREAEYTYLEPALFSVTYHLVARADDAIDISSWDDVRSLGDKGIILAMHGFGQVVRLKEIGGLMVDSGSGDAGANLRKLVAGRGRFYYHRSPGIAGEIRKAGLDAKVRILPALMDLQRFYLVAGKHVPPATVARLNRALTTLETNGELRRLFGKWYDDNAAAAVLPVVQFATVK